MPGTIAITDLLRVEDVHPHFEALSVIDAIPVLLGPALAHHVSRADVRDEIIAAVIKRERETATACGTLSLPHARHAMVDEFVVSVGANANGIVAAQKEPRIIFAFVSPERKREEHLHFLASLARLSQNRTLVDVIAGANDPEDVLAALRNAGL
jgi:mannitol/fructose-specific phosphotransferase system IIA component (Ntr-type)